MNVRIQGLGWLVGLLAVQAVPAQDVSLYVKSQFGTVGGPCDAFVCAPHAQRVIAGRPFAVGMYGAPQMPYVLAIGAFDDECRKVPGIDHLLALRDPVLTLEVGAFGASGFYSWCGTELATTSIVVPAFVPGGAMFRLQLLAAASQDDGFAFSRAVEITVV